MISKREISQIIADQQMLRFNPGGLPRVESGFTDQEITVISGVRRDTPEIIFQHRGKERLQD